MTKLITPLLSLDAHGTIGDSVTFQSSTRRKFSREKPVPADPESALQLAWRQIYRDAVAAWHALSEAERQAWRGVCPGLTGYQCFMKITLLTPPTPPTPGQLILQGVGKDTSLDEERDLQEGNSLWIAVRNVAGYSYRSILQFPITWGTDIPVGATITAATLSLNYYYHYANDPVGRTLWAYRLLRLDFMELEAGWIIYKTGNNWTTAGAKSDGNDFTSDDGASAVVPAAYGWMEWDVLNQLLWAQTNICNPAFLVRDGAVGNYCSFFHSKEYAADPDLRPKLVIDYTW